MPPKKKLPRKGSRAIQQALQEHKRSDIDVEGTIQEAMTTIQKDPDFPRLPDGVKALRSVVLRLLKEYPGVGFEQWKPPTHEGGKDGGPKWEEAVSSMQSWWDRHTGYR